MTHYQQFADHNAGAEPLTQAEIDETLQWVMRHGPANCWTGTSGDPCRMIRALLIERANLLAMLAKVQTP